MLFNSGTFLQFFAAFILLYYCVRNHLTARNVLIVLASYLFYGWWDYRFLALLIFSSLLDYSVGIGLAQLQNQTQRKLLVGISIVINLTILGFFKYYDFFISSLAALLSTLGLQPHLSTLQVILPVGISFYTFQTMSYAIDVYRGELPATRNLVEFLAYVSFFPQLVAGPIERAKHLLPQFAVPRTITRLMLEEGIWLCIWGMFKKVVLADNLAPLVEMVYDHPRPGGLLVSLATVAFGLQIYCDFSGYSDIARGTARMLGFDIMLNFNLPYLASSLREFWRRWHISLSTWLRDYLYISLGGNRCGATRNALNVFVTMLLGGLWHGAAWNFVAWGAWHGGGLALHRVWARSRVRETSAQWSSLASVSVPVGAGAGPSTEHRQLSDQQPAPDSQSRIEPDLPPRTPAARLAAWGATMLFVFYGWLLFRAGSWHQVVALTQDLLDPTFPAWTQSYCWTFLVFILPLLTMETWQAYARDLLAPLRWPLPGRAALEGLLLVAILMFWEKEKVPFIYFQF